MKWSIALFCLITVFAACEKKKEAQVPRTNDLPALLITTTQGHPIFTKNLSGKTILVLFQPDCDHCQREAQQIRDNLNSFQAYEVYFISTAETAELEKFSREYKLENEPNVHFANTSLDYILNSLGSIDAPSVFVYSAEGKLIKHFNGEVEIAEILSVLDH